MGHSSDGWGFVVGPPNVDPAKNNLVIITRNLVTGNFLEEEGEISFSNGAFYKRYTLYSSSFFFVFI